MALTVGELVAYLKLDGKNFESGLDSAGTKMSSFAGKLGKAGLIGVAAGATAALAGLGAVIHTGVGEIMDASAGQAQLAAGIKSTGNAAGVTVDGMEKLASSIQNYSGQTDDSIVQTESLLLTFTNIKNKGPNKIFDQATIAAADMAAKMGGDASGAAIQLGKALNDPVKGVTALQKVGVSFTDAQKKQIAAMVKAGDVAGAQKIILGELSTEFGGAAKAAGDALPGGIEKAKRAFEDLAQGAITTLIPILVPAIQAITKGFQFLAPIIQKVFEKIAPFLQDIGKAVGKIFDAFSNGGLSGGLSAIGDAIGAALPIIGAKLFELGKAFLEWIGPMIPPMLVKLGELLVQLGQWLIGTALPSLRVHLVEWAKEFAAWIGPALPGILLELGKILLKIGEWILLTALPAIVINLGKLALGLLEALGTALKPLALIMAKPFEDAWGAIKGGWNTASAWIGAIPGHIKDFFVGGLTWLEGAGHDIINGLWNGLKYIWNTYVAAWLKLGQKVKDAVGDLGSILYDSGKAIIQGLWNGMKFIWGQIEAWAKKVADGLSWVVKKVLGISSPSKVFHQIGVQTMQGLADGLQDGLTGLVQPVLAAATDAVAGALPDSDIYSMIANSPQTQQSYANGGWNNGTEWTVPLPIFSVPTSGMAYNAPIGGIQHTGEAAILAAQEAERAKQSAFDTTMTAIKDIAAQQAADVAAADRQADILAALRTIADRIAAQNAAALTLKRQGAIA